MSDAIERTKSILAQGDVFRKGMSVAEVDDLLEYFQHRPNDRKDRVDVRTISNIICGVGTEDRIQGKAFFNAKTAIVQGLASFRGFDQVQADLGAVGVEMSDDVAAKARQAYNRHMAERTHPAIVAENSQALAEMLGKPYCQKLAASNPHAVEGEVVKEMITTIKDSKTYVDPKVVEAEVRMAFQESLPLGDLFRKVRTHSSKIGFSDVDAAEIGGAYYGSLAQEMGIDLGTDYGWGYDLSTKELAAGIVDALQPYFDGNKKDLQIGVKAAIDNKVDFKGLFEHIRGDAVPGNLGSVPFGAGDIAKEGLERATETFEVQPLRIPISTVLKDIPKAFVEGRSADTDKAVEEIVLNGLSEGRSAGQILGAIRKGLGIQCSLPPAAYQKFSDALSIQAGQNRATVNEERSENLKQGLDAFGGGSPEKETHGAWSKAAASGTLGTSKLDTDRIPDGVKVNPEAGKGREASAQ